MSSGEVYSLWFKTQANLTPLSHCHSFYPFYRATFFSPFLFSFLCLSFLLRFSFLTILLFLIKIYSPLHLLTPLSLLFLLCSLLRLYLRLIYHKATYINLCLSSVLVCILLFFSYTPPCLCFCFCNSTSCTIHTRTIVNLPTI